MLLYRRRQTNNFRVSENLHTALERDCHGLRLYPQNKARQEFDLKRLGFKGRRWPRLDPADYYYYTGIILAACTERDRDIRILLYAGIRDINVRAHYRTFKS